jgi:hypothetical protein
VVARDDDLRKSNPLEPCRRLLELPVVAGGRQIACDHDDVRPELVDARKDHVEILRGQTEWAAEVDVADLRDPERELRDFRVASSAAEN